MKISFWIFILFFCLEHMLVSAQLTKQPPTPLRRNENGLGGWGSWWDCASASPIQFDVDAVSFIPSMGVTQVVSRSLSGGIVLCEVHPCEEGSWVALSPTWSTPGLFSSGSVGLLVHQGMPFILQVSILSLTADLDFHKISWCLA